MTKTKRPEPSRQRYVRLYADRPPAPPRAPRFERVSLKQLDAGKKAGQDKASRPHTSSRAVRGNGALDAGRVVLVVGSAALGTALLAAVLIGLAQAGK
jgi:hypothetical protein